MFTPGAPINEYALFAGRTEQIKRVVNAVAQRGQHAVIFGERGVGKTSLANAIAELLRSVDLHTARVNCSLDDDFTSIWKKALREIVMRSVVAGVGFGRPTEERSQPLSAFLGNSVEPEEVRYLLQQFNQPALIIFDEMDRLTNPDTSRLLADTIKALSDNSVPVTLVLVGVADTVGDLIAEHASIERSLVQIQMPRMSIPELREIIDKGLARLGMSIQEEARARIAFMSQGLPHYTHLLALHATWAAIDANRQEITMDDVQAAIKNAVTDAQQSILDVYHRATRSPRRDNLYGQVLLACALARKDELGYFAASDVRKPMSMLMKRRYDIPAFARHLNDFCEKARGPVLQKSGTRRRFRYRFVNPLLQPFVIMNGLSKGFLTEEALSRYV